MKAISWIILIILLFLLGALTIFYFFQLKSNCEFGKRGNCNTACQIDSDCKFELGQCVNVNEKVYLPRKIIPVYQELTCRCENNKCVGDPTGNIFL